MIMGISAFFFFCFFCGFFVFFFQAEDGIRYLVRSRGLGDVYKRQGYASHTLGMALYGGTFQGQGEVALAVRSFQTSLGPVSYTHLTLPTSDLV